MALTKKPVHLKILQLLYQFAASHPAPSKIILVATHPIYDYFLSSFVDQFGHEVVYVTCGMQKSKAFVPAYGVQMLNLPLIRDSCNEIASKKPTVVADSSNENSSRKPICVAETDDDSRSFVRKDCDNVIDSLSSTEKRVVVEEANKEEEADVVNGGFEGNSEVKQFTKGNLKEAMEMHTIFGSLPKEKEEGGSPVSRTKSVDDLFENCSKVFGTKLNEVEPGKATEEPAKMVEGNFVKPTGTSKESSEGTDLGLEEENLDSLTETETDSEVAFMNSSESVVDQDLLSLLSEADKVKEGTEVPQLTSSSSVKASVLVTGFPDHISEMMIFKWLRRKLGAGLGSEIRSVDSETGSAVVQFRNRETALKVVSLLDGSLFDKNKLTASVSEYSSATSEDSSVVSEDSSAMSEDSSATSEDSSVTSEDSSATSEDSSATSEDSSATSEDSSATSEDSSATPEDSNARFEDSSARFEDSSARFEDSSARSVDSSATSKDSKATSENSKATSDRSYLPPSKKKSAPISAIGSFSTRSIDRKQLLRKRIIDLLEETHDKKRIASSLFHEYLRRHHQFMPIKSLYGRKPWLRFIEDNSDMKIEIIDRQMYICLVKHPKKETSKATISTLTKSPTADNQGQSAENKGAGVASKGYGGVASKGEGVARKGEGVASNGYGVASKGYGVASKGDGVAGKGDGVASKKASVASKGESGDNKGLSSNANYHGSGNDKGTDKKQSYFSSLLQKIKERIY